LNQSNRQTRQDTCQECGDTNIIIDNTTGERICQKCGIVQPATELSTNPEWRAFTPSERDNLPRVGAPATLLIHDRGLSTNISWQNKDASGKTLSPEAREKLYRLRKWHQRSKVSDSRNRNLSQALSQMTKAQSILNLPKNVIETSSQIYRQALNANIIRGRTIQSIASACIYLACRQCGVVRSIEEVAHSFELEKKDLARNYRFLVKTLTPNVPQVNTEGYIGKLVSKLGLSGSTEMTAMAILDTASDMRLTGGRGPAGMAAACIYISTRLTDELRTQGDIARVAQVTEVTIRNRYKELIKELEIIINL